MNFYRDYSEDKRVPFDAYRFSEKIRKWHSLDNDREFRFRLARDGASDFPCARCKNTIWKNSGYYFRPRNKKEWIVFCRIDCAFLSISDKIEELVTFDQYINKIITSKP